MLNICYVLLLMQPLIFNCGTPEAVRADGEKRGFQYLGEFKPDGYGIIMGQSFNPDEDIETNHELDLSIIVQVWRSKSGYPVYVEFHKDMNGRLFCFRKQSRNSEFSVTPQANEIIRENRNF